MARTTINDQLLLNNGKGNLSAIATGVFATKAIDMSERRRLSLTAGFGGGFTGTLLVEGTDEIGNVSVGIGLIQQATGAAIQAAGVGQQPGQNGVTGAKFWTALPSGTVSVTNSTNSVQVQLNDVNCRWIRVSFNKGVPVAIGSGTIELFVTAKCG